MEHGDGARPGNGKGGGNGHSARSERDDTPSVNEAARTAPRGIVGFFDRAIERWHALRDRQSARKRSRDAERAARDARERYMGPAYIDSEESLRGPRNEGAYQYPIEPRDEERTLPNEAFRAAPRVQDGARPWRPGDRWQSRQPAYESEPDHQPGSLPPPGSIRGDQRRGTPGGMPEASRDYDDPSRWHSHDSHDRWESVSRDDWPSRYEGSSPDDGADLWSHEIPRDPRSDRSFRDRNQQSPISRAAFGDPMPGRRDVYPRSYGNEPERTAPPRGRRRGQR